MMMEFKVFNDLVHGHMVFHPLLVIVVDTPQVQRLRNIKQLGCCYFVYPSASHNRFEHCLGTAHIAGKLFEKLKERGTASNLLDEKDWEKRKLCVQVAGLCHDVGHGPFSHTWEKFRHKVSANDDWTHEEESTRVLDDILKETICPVRRVNGTKLKTVRDVFHLYGLGSVEIEIIKNMILGRESSTHYLFQIINNRNNDIDVDKWDYLARDSVMLNVPIGFDYKRLLNYCCVLKNSEGEEEICFREKECSALIEMFLARAKLHDKAYQHPKVKIIEEMLTDAFVLANDRLKLTETPMCQLSDHIYQRILHEDFGRDENMRKAKEILRRIEKRDLYKCIAKESFEDSRINTDMIMKRLKMVATLEPYLDDITVTAIRFDMTRSNKEKTLKNVSVYQKTNGQMICKKFDWHKYDDSLKPNIENLKRQQVLVLYKGEHEFPESLMEGIKNHVQRILIDSVQ